MIKKRADLRAFDILVCDASWIGDGRMSDIYYVVIYNEEGHKVAVSFHGNVNNPEEGNKGFYDLDGWESAFELPMDCVAVYRPKHFTNTFHGDFENAVDWNGCKLYDCIYRRKESD